MREFFGFGGYQRPVEGYFSWQHILFVSVLLIIMVVLAIVIGSRMRHGNEKQKKRVLIVSAILIDSFELFKIVLLCFRSGDPFDWLYNLPLFLCSIQLITIPLAAFARGRVKEAALDFVFIFGILGALLGTIAAGNIYGAYPVLSFDCIISGLTHMISGFASLYIGISGMSSMKSKNLPITFAILGGFCVAAYIAGSLLDYNYMFLFGGDGTPYDIVFNIVGGNAVLYPLFVVALFIAYIMLFHTAYVLIRNSVTARSKTAEV